MKRNIVRATLLLISLATVSIGLAPAAQAATCSTATTAGNWGATLTGTLILPTGPVPVGAVVNATLDLQGNATGTEGRSVGGQYADETFSGNVTVKEDCTGTATLKFYGAAGELVRTSELTIVFDDNSKEMRMVQKSLMLPDGVTQLPVVITVDGKKH
jgi:hypothetical protein